MNQHIEQRIAELVNDGVRNTPYAEASDGWKMTCVNTAKLIVAALEPDTDRGERQEHALVDILAWASAYNPRIFPPMPDETVKHAADVLRAGGISCDRLHAHWARHLLKGIGDIARAGLGKDEP